MDIYFDLVFWFSVPLILADAVWQRIAQCSVTPTVNSYPAKLSTHECCADLTKIFIICEKINLLLIQISFVLSERPKPFKELVHREIKRARRGWPEIMDQNLEQDNADGRGRYHLIIIDLNTQRRYAIAPIFAIKLLAATAVFFRNLQF